MSEQLCIMEGCTKTVHVKKRGLCSTHFTYWARDNKPKVGHTPCDVDDCESVVYAKGFCLSHYNKNRLHGTPTPAPRVKAPKGKCAVDFCERQATVADWCKGHYMQQWMGKPFTPLQTKVMAYKDDKGRVCTKCDTYQPWEQFSMNNDGNRRSMCRACNVKATRARKLAKLGGIDE